MIKRIYLLALLFPLQVFAQTLKVGGLNCEYKTNPVGIEAKSPKLSWVVQSDGNGVMQMAYHVIVADNIADINKNVGNAWDSKRVNSSASIQVNYAGKVLQATKNYYWKVTVWNNKGHSSGWSNIAQWQMGLLIPSDWQNAKWIAYAQMPDSMRLVPFPAGRGPKSAPPVNDVLPLLRKTFAINKPIKKATLFISGLGHFDMSLAIIFLTPAGCNITSRLYMFLSTLQINLYKAIIR